MEDLLITDKGEFFATSPAPELGDKEALLRELRDHEEIFEFEFKYSLEDPLAYDMMSRQLRHVDGQLPLLRRSSLVILPKSRNMALRRLDGLKKRLSKNPELHKCYAKQILTTLRAGYAEKVNPDVTTSSPKEWYIPHHPVFNSKKPVKVRIVYDCAASSQNNSLNDFFMKGPDLTNSIVGVLTRFTKESVAIVTDVEALYHQVFPPGKDALRFFWWPEGNLSGNPDTHRMTVHLFGAKNSLSCASCCLRETARKFGKHYDGKITELVYKNVYVNDCLVSVDSTGHVIKVVENLRQLFSKEGFKLGKWLSSTDVVM